MRVRIVPALKGNEELKSRVECYVKANEKRRFLVAAKARHKHPAALLREIFRKWMDDYVTGDF